MDNQQVENSNLTNEINDLEPDQTEEIKGGQTREHVLLARQTQVAGNTSVHGDWNGNGTVSSGDYNPWNR